LASGQTSLIVDGPIHEEASQYYYFYAQTADGGTYWAGPLTVQITDNVFDQSYWDNTGMDRAVGFRELDTDGYENFVLTFVGDTPWAGPWPVYQHDARHSGLSTIDTSASAGVIQWNFSPGGGSFSAPVLDADGTIYAGATDFNLYALKPDGSLKWSFSPGVSIQIWTTPAIAGDGTVYFGAIMGYCTP
jgi:outer membrane protein assembly factor BamB